MNPLISVIVPTYQSGRTLVSALGSVHAQTFQNIEVLVMDGGSNDETIRIAERFLDQYTNFRFFTAADKGVYDAMNKGVEAALGEWIFFLGSDDQLFDQNTLERVSKELTNEVDVVYGDVISSRFNGRYDGQFSISKIFEKNICHQAIFFRRTVFDSIGKFNLKYKICADWDHNMRWFFSSNVRKKYVPEVVAIYADGGLSSRTIDDVFFHDRKLLYVEYGRLQLSCRRKASLIRDELVRAIKFRDLRLLFRTLLVMRCLIPLPVRLAYSLLAV